MLLEGDGLVCERQVVHCQNLYELNRQTRPFQNRRRDLWNLHKWLIGGAEIQ